MYFLRFPLATAICFATSLVHALPSGENIIAGRGSGLKVSDNPKDWPSTAQLEAALATKSGGAFFWTGRNGDVSVEEQAASIAAKAGGLTLESGLAAHNIIMPAFDTRNTQAVNIWESASRILAQKASGEVFCVQGATLRPNNVFETIELPALKANKAVTKVTRIDSKTGAKSPIFPLAKLVRDVEEDEEVSLNDFALCPQRF